MKGGCCNGVPLFCINKFYYICSIILIMAENEKEDLVGLNLVIPRKIRKDLNMLAAIQQRTMKDMFLEMFADYKKKYGAK